MGRIHGCLQARLATALLAVAVLAGCHQMGASMQATIDSGNAHIVLDGRAIDVTGQCNEVNSRNGHLSILCSGHRIEISGREVTIDGRRKTLPDYLALIVACERDGVKVGIDGAPPSPW